MSEQVQILIGGLFGIIIHILLKVKDINSDLQTENYRSVFKAYWRYDWPAVLISAFFMLVVSYTADEWLGLKATNIQSTSITGILFAKLSAVTKILGFLIGLVADYLVGLIASVTKNKLRQKALSEGLSMGDITPEPKIKSKP